MLLKRGGFYMWDNGFIYRVADDRGMSVGVLLSDRSLVPCGYHCPERPVVGDDVVVDEELHLIVEILPRRSWIARARPTGTPQFVAANVTTGVIVTSPDPREFSPRRVARYLIALRSGCVDPVIVLNKCDAGFNAEGFVAALRSVAGGAPVVPISARDGTNCGALEPYLEPSATLALCGWSGVGKSTLLNRLLGCAAMATDRTRDDGRGRHTTTHRRLFVLPSGTAIIDTPGMRTFSAWASAGDVDDSFGDIGTLSESCRFGDCSHSSEPGCAVVAGAEPERLSQWRKLRREAEWLASRDNAALAAERKREWKRIHKAAREPRRIADVEV
ncbi:MAG: ribosome small subunit-dependent GTPase A [Candidatus Cybelea sp.]